MLELHPGQQVGTTGVLALLHPGQQVSQQGLLALGVQHLHPSPVQRRALAPATSQLQASLFQELATCGCSAIESDVAWQVGEFSATREYGTRTHLHQPPSPMSPILVVTNEQITWPYGSTTNWHIGKGIFDNGPGWATNHLTS